MPPRCCGEPVLPMDYYHYYYYSYHHHHNAAVLDRDRDHDHNDDDDDKAKAHPALRLLDPAARAAWAEAVRRARDVSKLGVGAGAAAAMVVDRSVIRIAKHSKGPALFQFCRRCYRLVMRSGGCNHMT